MPRGEDFTSEGPHGMWEALLEHRSIGRNVASLRREWRPIILPGVLVCAMAATLTIGGVNDFDVSEYARYAHAALRAPLFSHLPVEYPAPALLIFIVPLAAPGTYQVVFALLAAITFLTLVVTMEGPSFSEGRVPAQRLVTYFGLGAVAFFTARYDIFAVLAAFLAVRSARSQRWSAAWSWSSVGFLLKLFPAVLWPVFFIGEWKRSGRLPLRRLVWAVTSVALVSGLPALLSPGATLTELRFYLHRPVELGSMAAGISLLAHWHDWHYVLSYHSMNTLDSVAAPLATALAVVAGAGCLLVWHSQAKGRLSIEASALATLTLLVLGMKVFSVQYLMWLMPFWALYRLRATLLAACVINTAIFPYSQFAGLPTYGPAYRYVTLLFLLRDTLILFGSVMWLREVLGARRAALPASARVSSGIQSA